MITTTMDKALNAFMALTRIRSKVRGKEALHLFHLKNVLQENINFLTEEEARLVEENGGVITDTGAIVIADPEKRKAYQQARKELGEMECEVHTDPVKVSLDKNEELTMEDIELLDGFVIFE